MNKPKTQSKNNIRVGIFIIASLLLVSLMNGSNATLTTQLTADSFVLTAHIDSEINDGSDRFFNPQGTLSNNTHFFVLDRESGNQSIKVYNQDGIFQYQIGSPGSGPGLFDVPIFMVLVDKTIYVTDRGSDDKVMAFDTNGTFLMEFDEGLSNPYGIAFHGEHLWVVDNVGIGDDITHVKIYQLDGLFEGEYLITETSFLAIGIYVDDDYFYLVNWIENDDFELLVFNHDGTLIASVSDPDEFMRTAWDVVKVENLLFVTEASIPSGEVHIIEETSPQTFEYQGIFSTNDPVISLSANDTHLITTSSLDLGYFGEAYFEVYQFAEIVEETTTEETTTEETTTDVTTILESSTTSGIESTTPTTGIATSTDGGSETTAEVSNTITSTEPSSSVSTSDDPSSDLTSTTLSSIESTTDLSEELESDETPLVFSIGIIVILSTMYRIKRKKNR